MTRRHEQITPGVAEHVANGFAACVPTLVGKRIGLRAVRLADFDAYAQVACTERGAYIGGPMKREDAWYDFLSLCSGWMLHGHGGWAVEEADTGKLAGFVCLGLEPGDQEVELGFLLCSWAEGKGMAFEAAVEARTYAWTALKLKTLVSYIDARNTRSIALAKRLGAFDDTPADFETGMRVFRHLNPNGAHA